MRVRSAFALIRTLTEYPAATAITCYMTHKVAAEAGEVRGEKAGLAWQVVRGRDIRENWDCTCHDLSASDFPSTVIKVQHSLLPALRGAFTPPASLQEEIAITQVADLEALYKIFERC